ncbi:MAG TPA: orotidine-5'-phosphate decarboxylase [Candidatus Acidoferrales bacterium]|nr:orotidine-5'-phosphate decarboxylase [Candidatus Acidoferrales bacterium]
MATRDSDVLTKEDLSGIAKRRLLPIQFVENVVDTVSATRIPVSKRINVLSNGENEELFVTRKGYGLLSTDFGKFLEYDFAINDGWNKYSVLVRAETNLVTGRPIFSKQPLLVRIDSGCETGQLFGDRTCECREQLELAMEEIKTAKEGIIIHIPHQDARGLGLPFKLAALTLQDTLRIDTVEAAEILTKKGTIDTRTYAGAVAILKFFEITTQTKIDLATNNLKKTEILKENGYEIANLVPVLVNPTELTKIHLDAKQEKLGHINLKRKDVPAQEERNFFDLLDKAMVKNKSLVCCGLDPDIAKMPYEMMPYSSSTWQPRMVEEKVLEFLKAVVDITSPHVCSYKLQKAFFEQFYSSNKILADTINYIKTKYPSLPVILDSKVGDIDNTMGAYTQTAFNKLGVDAMVINPYMGSDVLQPFQNMPTKGAIVLVKTSNPGGAELQDIITSNGKPLWMETLELAVKKWNGANNIIPVISTTAGIDFGMIRQIIPDTMPIFLAGFGAQGGELSDFDKILDSRGRGAIINSSRHILYPYNRNNENWRSEIEKSVVDMKIHINSLRDTNVL